MTRLTGFLATVALVLGIARGRARGGSALVEEMLGAKRKARMRPVKLVVALGCFGLACVSSTVAHGAEIVIFDNGAPDLVTAFFSDSDSTGLNIGFQSADNFVLPSGFSTISDVHWFGSYAACGASLQGCVNGAPTADDFTINVYADDASGSPGTLLTSLHVGSVSRTDTGDDVAGIFDLFAYSAIIPPLALDPLTTYWLSIVNDTAGSMIEWAWATSHFEGGNAQNRQTFPTVGNWALVFPRAELSFNLTATTNSVPEPSTLLLLTLGVLVLGWSRWRRRGL